mmetsp:Transcript_38811/g.109820  ORF Transcript_38811/g.109820 Transcript_38811/m.109820 type:complete len:83 (+) Transcript_38811:78-326(+)
MHDAWLTNHWRVSSMTCTLSRCGIPGGLFLQPSLRGDGHFSSGRAERLRGILLVGEESFVLGSSQLQNSNPAVVGTLPDSRL